MFSPNIGEKIIYAESIFLPVLLQQVSRVSLATRDLTVSRAERGRRATSAGVCPDKVDHVESPEFRAGRDLREPTVSTVCLACR